MKVIAAALTYMPYRVGVVLVPSKQKQRDRCVMFRCSAAGESAVPNFQAQQGANGRKLLHLHSCQIHMCLLSLRKDMKNEVRMVEVIPAPVLAQHITARAPCQMHMPSPHLSVLLSDGRY